MKLICAFVLMCCCNATKPGPTPVPTFVPITAPWRRTAPTEGPTTLAPTPGPSTTPPKPETHSNSTGQYKYLGCFKDEINSRAFSSMNVLEKNGPSACEDLCLSKNKDYVVFGLQNTEECFCGKSDDDVYRTGTAPEDECDSICPDGSGETCGGRHRMNVYVIPNPENEVCSKAYLCEYYGLGDHKTGFECDGKCDTEQCCESVENEVCSKAYLCEYYGLGDHKTGFECNGKCDTEQCCESVENEVCSKAYLCEYYGLGDHKTGFECDGKCDTEQCCSPITCSGGFNPEECKHGFYPDVECNEKCDSIQCCISTGPSPMPITTGKSGYHVRDRN